MISALISKFAAEPVIHITPLPIFTIGGLEITNSMFYGVVSSILTITILVIAAKRMSVFPKGGLIQMVEVGTDFITDTLKSALDDEKKAVKYAPYFVFDILFYHVQQLAGAVAGCWPGI